MTGRRKATESTSVKPKLPEVPLHVFDEKNNKQYEKGDFLGKVGVRLQESVPIAEVHRATGNIVSLNW